MVPVAAGSEKERRLLQMRVLLQNGETGMFYIREGEWDSDVKRALNFRTARAAAEMAYRLWVPKARVYYAFPDPSRNYSDVV